MQLKEIRSCLITGATSGIGKALALALAEKNVPLLLTGRNSEELKSLQQQTGAEIYATDLANLDNVKALSEWIDKKNPNVQIHNAGYGLRGEYEQLSDQEIIDMINVNCTTLALQTRGAIDRWKRRGEGGIIVNVASVVGHFPFPFSSLYAATKAFVRNLSLSVEGEEKGNIHVLTSCPGAVETAFFSRSRKGGDVRNNPLTMPVSVATQSIIRQIETEKDEVVFDWKYALFTRIFSKFAPLSFFTKVSKKGG